MCARPLTSKGDPAERTVSDHCPRTRRQAHKRGFSYVGTCQVAFDFSSLHMTTSLPAQRAPDAVRATAASKGPRRTQSAIRAQSPSWRGTAQEIKYEPADTHSHFRAQTS